MSRSRRQKNKRNGLLFKLLLFAVFAVLAAAAFGGSIAERVLPSKEVKELTEWLEVSGDELRIYLDGQADFDCKGIAENGRVYLPAEFVCDSLNSRFFLSGSDGMLSYTLPDETVDMSEDTETDGAPDLMQRDGQTYILIDTVSRYTDISYDAFADENEAAKRVFIYHGGTSRLEAEITRKTQIRVRRDIKSPMLAELAKGEHVIVADRNDAWCSVISESGISGYVRTKAVSAPEESTVPDSYTEPEVQHTLLGERPVVGWHGIYTAAGNASLDEVLKTAGGHINVISPTWIQISGSDGSYINYSSTDYVSKAHAAGLKVWVSVDNFNRSEAVADFNTGEYFASAANRRDFISRLMNDAARFGYDGFNLDFEGIRPEAGEAYAQFFRELSVECRKAGLVLSIDNYVPYGFNDFYRMDEQGVFADYTAVMLYDEHTSDVGSNSSLPYVRYGLEESIKDVPADRIIAGLPLYTRLWTEDEDGNVSSETMSIERAARYAAESGMQLEWDETDGQYCGEVKDGALTKLLWLEDAESMKAKKAVTDELGIGGIAVWRLGYDTSDIWNVLD